MKAWKVLAALGSLVALGGALVAVAPALGLVSNSATAAFVSPRASAVGSAPEVRPAKEAPAATAAIAAAVEAAPSAAPEARAPEPIDFQQTFTYGGGVVFVPRDCGAGDYDVVLHFHGAHPYVRELVSRAGLRSVVVAYNVGNGAEVYGREFQFGGMLNSLLGHVARAVTPLCPGGRPGRVALSAWSAGYSAVEKLLARPEDRARVDAVLLADGLHAAFVDPRRRAFAPNALESFVQFGREAVAGKKLFAITHSSIETPTYGSTTECSRLLLKKLGLEPPRNPATSTTTAGEFSLVGSPGLDKAAHVAQFRHMDEGPLAKLRQRWSRR